MLSPNSSTPSRQGAKQLATQKPEQKENQVDDIVSVDLGHGNSENLRALLLERLKLCADRISRTNLECQPSLMCLNSESNGLLALRFTRSIVGDVGDS